MLNARQAKSVTPRLRAASAPQMMPVNFHLVLDTSATTLELVSRDHRVSVTKTAQKVKSVTPPMQPVVSAFLPTLAAQQYTATLTSTATQQQAHAKTDAATWAIASLAMFAKTTHAFRATVQLAQPILKLMLLIVTTVKSVQKLARVFRTPCNQRFAKLAGKHHNVEWIPSAF